MSEQGARTRLFPVTVLAAELGLERSRRGSHPSLITYLLCVLRTRLNLSELPELARRKFHRPRQERLSAPLAEPRARWAQQLPGALAVRAGGSLDNRPPQTEPTENCGRGGPEQKQSYRASDLLTCGLPAQRQST